MKSVRNHIEARQKSFANVRFFEQLRATTSAESALSFVRGLSFFVLAFQDILRLNEANVTHPTLRKIARHHRGEDRDHDLWFLEDVLDIDGAIPDAEELFSPRDAATRDASYALTSEVFRATDDRIRIVLLLVLEATGHVFFTSIVNQLEKIGYDRQLRYFGREHLNVELNHELFEKQINAWLDQIELTDAESAVAMATADRCFDAMTTMMESLASFERLSTGPASIAPVSGVRSNGGRVTRLPERTRRAG